MLNSFSVKRPLQLSEKFFTAATTFIASSSLCLHTEILQCIPNGMDLASFFAQNHFRSWLSDYSPVIGKKFGGILIAAILEPAGDDSRFNLEQRIPYHRYQLEATGVPKAFLPSSLDHKAGQTISWSYLTSM